MNVLDWVLVVLAAAYALSGYWQGFVTGAFATAGLLIGGAAGIWLAPIALGDAEPSLWVSLGALLIVILSASLGQALFQFIGAQIRAGITWHPARALDAVGGAALSAVAALLVAWALGVAVSGSQLGPVTAQVRGSTVLGTVDRFLPTSASGMLRAFDEVVGTTFFPRYLEPFAPEQIVQVDPGPRRIATDPDVVDTTESVLKVRGSNVCGRGLEGTGFVFAEDRLMTNAHVVAGVRYPEVIAGDQALPATVVHYDPDLDVAVLSFDSSGIPVLPFDDTAEAGEGVAVAGYPLDGPFRIDPARIRAQQRLRSPDIYGDGAVLREVFSLRATIQPGNSGGPLLSSAGEVVGVVFAASVTDAETGYALTATQVAESAAAGLAGSARVGTGECAA